MTHRRKEKKDESHVRMYAHELECPAYCSMKADARALLIEFRALYGGGRNRIFMSIREMQRRLGGVGQRKAQAARDQLLERGWIAVIERGAFHRKTRVATMYALTNHPIDVGDIAPRPYMRWRSAPKKNTVVETTADSRRNALANESMAAVPDTDSSHFDAANEQNHEDAVAVSATQIRVPLHSLAAPGPAEQHWVQGERLQPGTQGARLDS